MTLQETYIERGRLERLNWELKAQLAAAGNARVYGFTLAAYKWGI